MANLPKTRAHPEAPLGGSASQRRHGGRRAGAGRKPSARPPVLHRTRPLHQRRHPAHVTVPFRRGLARTLRSQRVLKLLRTIFQAPRIEGFHVVHHSVQDDHVHLIVEAVDRDAFSSGMRSLTIRAALRLNALLGHRGQVVRDRYHRRDLFSARQVRDALRYVLLNGVKHRRVGPGELDPCSSASSFDGWDMADVMITGPPPSLGPPISPWTRLLAADWKRLGLLSPYEAIRFIALPP